ncbi:MAG TPA: hypothetical protein V6D11_15050 [Waterburya sp.]
MSATLGSSALLSASVRFLITRSMNAIALSSNQHFSDYNGKRSRHSRLALPDS